jgi:hypothetical protein
VLYSIRSVVGVGLTIIRGAGDPSEILSVRPLPFSRKRTFRFDWPSTLSLGQDL